MSQSVAKLYIYNIYNVLPWVVIAFKCNLLMQISKNKRVHFLLVWIIEDAQSFGELLYFNKSQSFSLEKDKSIDVQ